MCLDSLPRNQIDLYCVVYLMEEVSSKLLKQPEMSIGLRGRESKHIFQMQMCIRDSRRRKAPLLWSFFNEKMDCAAFGFVNCGIFFGFSIFCL